MKQKPGYTIFQEIAIIILTTFVYIFFSQNLTETKEG